MARVDLKCGCGYKFFVGDAQLKSGVECPSCGSPVQVPGAAPAARKPAPAKPAAKPAPPPPPEDDEAEDFDSLPPAEGASKNKLYIIGGAVAVVVLVLVAVVLVIVMRPKV